MITKINKIRNLGIFEEFSWDASLPTFKTFNVFFGWNYSGKTTISRLFRCFEIEQKHPDYLSATFEIEDDQSNRHTDSNLNEHLPIRVFNTDFINDNLKWDHGIEPIFILGQQNIELQGELENERRSLTTKLAVKKRLQEKILAEESRIQNGLTSKARDIKNLLSRPNFTKTNFEPYVVKVSANSEDYKLKNPMVQGLITTVNSTDKKAIIEEIVLRPPPLKQVIDNAIASLVTTVETNVIEKLRADGELNEWVRKGKDLHKEKTICQFCGNELPKDLLERLNSHFSQSYDDLIDDIGNQIISIESGKVSLNLPDGAKFYQEFQNEYAENKTALEEEIRLLNEALKAIIENLETKKCKAFECLELPNVVDNTSIIQTIIKAINTTITKQNKKTEEFEGQRKSALERLLLHYASDFALREKYFETQQNIIKHKSDLETLIKEIDDVENKIAFIEDQLSETAKGAERINEYLSLYFGKGDLKARVTADNKFQLLRGKAVAKNLSEGEKTAIAFAYFITRLEDKKTTIPETIVYIDDPVSSLDSNHLFNTFSFIKTKLSGCGQLFISTHNFEFFNLIKAWLLSGKGMKKSKESFYMIERITALGTDKATISGMTPLLLKFHSEYCYLFSIIYDFKQKPTLDYHQLYNLPNILRRFMESLMSFKIPDGTGLESKIHILIPNEVAAERVRKFVHHYSHSSSVTRSLEFPDLKECEDITSIVLGSVKERYEEHYDALVQVVTNTAP
jgi:wobble nucleotide-excising tRNase